MKWMSEGEIRAVELAKEANQYVVVMTQGQGGGPVAGFPTLEEALEFVEKHKDEGSFAIIKPDGEWYKWEKEMKKKSEKQFDSMMEKVDKNEYDSVDEMLADAKKYAEAIKKEDDEKIDAMREAALKEKD